jgi:hypothetical protein
MVAHSTAKPQNHIGMPFRKILHVITVWLDNAAIQIKTIGIKMINFFRVSAKTDWPKNKTKH